MKETCSYRQETSRRDRMYNIAVGIKEIHSNGKTGARCSTLREHIRKSLGLEKLSGQEHLGDLRAHGDAIGGHGLHLSVTRKKVEGKSERVIMFTDEVLKSCDNFIASYQDSEIF